MDKNAVSHKKKIVFAWCMYDWANSVHALTVVSTIFPPFFNSIAINPKAEGNLQNYVEILGFTLKNEVLFAYSISFAFLLIALLNPILTAIADYSGRKKLFMKVFVYIGSISSFALAFFGTSSLEWLVLAFVLSLIGYSGSIVFYNAYLPEITDEQNYDKVSARGFALGYVGSVILLLFHLSMFLFPHFYGNISEDMSARISFMTTGIWWFAFAQYTFYYLPNTPRELSKKQDIWFLNGFQELKKVLKALKTQDNLKRFLLAFFFYNMGVQTVMYLAAEFGDAEIGVPEALLITTILILQLLAIIGAYGFSYFSKKYGNIRTLIGGVAFWIPVCLAAIFIQTSFDFILLGVTIGFVMGGIQSLSRSTYAKLMPVNTPDKASYFGFYDVTDKLSIVAGTLSYGLTAQLFGSVRYSVAILASFFMIGLVFLCFTSLKSENG